MKKSGNMNKFIFGSSFGSRKVGSNKKRKIIGKKK